jgi:hypothetical protein
MPAPKRVSWRAERRDLGALGFTSATTPRPSDAAAEQSSSTQRLTFQSFSPRVPSPPATPCRMIVRSVSSELVRLLTKLTAFSSEMYHARIRENASKTQDHNFSSDSIKAEPVLVEDSTRAVYSSRRHGGGSKSVMLRPSASPPLRNPITDRGCCVRVASGAATCLRQM